MPNKDRPLVDLHPPKNGVGWLMNTQEQKVCRFQNDMPTQHAQWVVVETRPLRGSGQPVIRRMLRHNAIEAWETMQKSGGWKHCPLQGLLTGSIRCKASCAMPPFDKGITKNASCISYFVASGESPSETVDGTDCSGSDKAYIPPLQPEIATLANIAAIRGIAFTVLSHLYSSS